MNNWQVCVLLFVTEMESFIVKFIWGPILDRDLYKEDLGKYTIIFV